MADNEEGVEPLHLEFEDREVYLAKIPVRALFCGRFVASSGFWGGEMTVLWLGTDGARHGLEERPGWAFVRSFRWSNELFS